MLTGEITLGQLGFYTQNKFRSQIPMTRELVALEYNTGESKQFGDS